MAAGAGTNIDSSNYRIAGVLALAGAALMAIHGVYAASTEASIPGLLSFGTALMCAAVVLLGVTITAVRGRNLSIALGMVGAVTGIAGALNDLFAGDPGILGSASLFFAFAGPLIVGLSFPKPRTGYPQAAVYAALSGAALLALVGVLGIITDDRLNDVAYVVPALAWAWLGRVLLGPNPLPARPIPAASPDSGATRTRPPGQAGQAGQTKKRPKRKPRKKP
jgi:hypothetical protein